MRKNEYPTGGKNEKELLPFLCSIFQKMRNNENFDNCRHVFSEKREVLEDLYKLARS